MKASRSIAATIHGNRKGPAYEIGHSSFGLRSDTYGDANGTCLKPMNSACSNATPAAPLTSACASATRQPSAATDIGTSVTSGAAISATAAARFAPERNGRCSPCHAIWMIQFAGSVAGSRAA